MAITCVFVFKFAVCVFVSTHSVRKGREGRPGLVPPVSALPNPPVQHSQSWLLDIWMRMDDRNNIRNVRVECSFVWDDNAIFLSFPFVNLEGRGWFLEFK